MNGTLREFSSNRIIGSVGDKSDLVTPPGSLRFITFKTIFISELLASVILSKLAISESVLGVIRALIITLIWDKQSKPGGEKVVKVGKVKIFNHIKEQRLSSSVSLILEVNIQVQNGHCVLKCLKLVLPSTPLNKILKDVGWWLGTSKWLSEPQFFETYYRSWQKNDRKWPTNIFYLFFRIRLYKLKINKSLPAW